MGLSGPSPVFCSFARETRMNNGAVTYRLAAHTSVKLEALLRENVFVASTILPFTLIPTRKSIVLTALLFCFEAQVAEELKERNFN